MVSNQKTVWLSRANHILFNPAADIELPRDPSRLPSVLSEEAIERVMQQPDLSETRALRDRAILECCGQLQPDTKLICGLLITRAWLYVSN
ncbi:hypothetical protein BTJ40_11820 [Microbulbifer sp. A4B17]|uniref:hypothetical protein n=1 Tax=Microbulbifer sp. A4B17 TaxID=359370 RepID=UPI000D52CBCF|nr:hypothetical protein [Microbulbifer sp. A4B17]AWF81451.1 hypothetical protein BTJ40_11820 [Microbulbifer sp. A4B17]